MAQIERLSVLRGRFRHRPPDILHAYFFWSILYGRLLKRAGVVRRLLENREDLGFNWGRHEYALLRMTRSAPDRVICVSEAVRDAVLRREGLPLERTRVIRNGVDAPTAERRSADTDDLRAEFAIPPTAPIVGMVANFNRPVKGAVHYVDALARVAASMPDVRFLLIGRGDNREALQARADAAGVGVNLVFTGFRDDVDRLYELMDVSALTSLSEGLSITILESMRHGVPVVATDVGGNSEVVRDGETGYLVPPGDPDAFADRVLGLLRDPGLRRRFGASAKETIRRDFALPTVADEYAAVYAEVMAGEN